MKVLEQAAPSQDDWVSLSEEERHTESPECSDNRGRDQREAESQGWNKASLFQKLEWRRAGPALQMPPGFQTSGPQLCERAHFIVLSHPMCAFWEDL